MREEMSRDGYAEKHTTGDDSKRDKGRYQLGRMREGESRDGERETEKEKAGELRAC